MYLCRVLEACIKSYTVFMQAVLYIFIMYRREVMYDVIQEEMFILEHSFGMNVQKFKQLTFIQDIFLDFLT